MPLFGKRQVQARVTGVRVVQLERQEWVAKRSEELEWQRGAELRAWGTSQDGVAWPAYETRPGERVGEKKETYSATFTAGDKQYEVSPPEAEWRALDQGGRCQLTLGRFGGVKTVTPAAG